MERFSCVCSKAAEYVTVVCWNTLLELQRLVSFFYYLLCSCHARITSLRFFSPFLYELLFKLVLVISWKIHIFWKHWIDCCDIMLLQWHRFGAMSFAMVMNSSILRLVLLRAVNIECVFAFQCTGFPLFFYVHTLDRLVWPLHKHLEVSCVWQHSESVALQLNEAQLLKMCL